MATRTETIRSLAADVDPIVFTSKTKVISAKTSNKSQRPLIKERAIRDSLLGKWSTVTWLWIILVPIVIYVLLLLLAPTFVTTTLNGDLVVDHSRILLWTLIISIIVWVLLWSLNYCRSC